MGAKLQDSILILGIFKGNSKGIRIDYMNYELKVQNKNRLFRRRCVKSNWNIQSIGVAKPQPMTAKAYVIFSPSILLSFNLQNARARVSNRSIFHTLCVEHTQTAQLHSVACVYL